MTQEITRWEYKVISFAEFKDLAKRQLTSDECLNILGREGWELVCTRWDAGYPLVGFPSYAP
jgi:hypothetical protein